MKIGVLITVFMLLCVEFSTAKVNKAIKIWYRQPATRWIDALPVGNGRIGAMVYGDPKKERISISESTLWCGKRDTSQNNHGGKDALDEVYNAYYQDNLLKAQQLLEQNFLGKQGTFGTNLPLGDLLINSDFPKGEIKNYTRELNLNEAVARVNFEIAGTRYSRETFISNPDQLMVIRYSASKGKAINQTITTDILRKGSVLAAGNQLILQGNTEFDKHGGIGSVNYYGILNVRNIGGNLSTSEKSINIKGADEVIITFVLNTDFNQSTSPENLCKRQIAGLADLDYTLLRNKHISDYRQLFDRVKFELNSDTDKSAIPTDKRIKAMANGSDDPQLSTLFFQFGRYLLIAGSRENSPLPLNLQGIWNDNKACRMAWTNDYHLDINTQQNYWPAEVCNLSECTAPLSAYVQSLVAPGRETARKVFGCKGWVTNTMNNVWGYTTPNWGFWGYFPEAGSWIASHLWDHYLFTQDQNYLKNVAYPVLKENAEFFLGYLRIHPTNGYLMGPSVSPENAFRYKGATISPSIGPTVQSVLMNMLFSSCIESCKILKVDAEFREKLEKAILLLPPLKIGSKGQVQEWFEDYEEAYPNHRHTSHLIALYPGSQINVNTPELEKAAITTIDNRMNRMDFEDVEWVRGNMVNYFARLRKGDEAYNHLVTLIKKHCSPTFLSFSASGIAGATEEIFIIDGTTAGTAGIAEMLLQSHLGEINLLPALPRSWSQKGSFSGLKARGGYSVDCTWNDGKVTMYKIYSSKSGKVKVRVNGELKEIAVTLK